jgi:hypothetical protein
MLSTENCGRHTTDNVCPGVTNDLQDLQGTEGENLPPEMEDFQGLHGLLTPSLP